MMQHNTGPAAAAPFQHLPLVFGWCLPGSPGCWVDMLKVVLAHNSSSMLWLQASGPNLFCGEVVSRLPCPGCHYICPDDCSAMGGFKNSTQPVRGVCGLAWLRGTMQWLRPLFVQRKMSVLWIGDELSALLTRDNYTAICDVIHSVLSGTEHAIYTNEGAWSLTDEEWDPVAKRPYSPFRDGIPPGIDVLSFDGYSAGTLEVDQHRALYQTSLYPKLAPHQRAAVVPGLFGCSLRKKGKCEANTSATGPHCMCTINGDDLSDEAQSAKLVAKLEGYMSWAREDPNIAGIIPWHWSNEMEMTAITPSYGLGVAAFPALVQKMLEYGWRNVSQLIQNCTPFISLSD